MNVGPNLSQPRNLERQIRIAFTGAVLLLAAILCVVQFMFFHYQMREDQRHRLHDTVSLAVIQLDGDSHATLTTPADESTPAYRRIKHTLQTILGSGSGLGAVHTLRVTATGTFRYVVDARTDPTRVSHINAVYHDAGPALRSHMANLNHAFVENDFHTDRWGTWLSAYAPFYRSDGRLEGLLCLDLSADTITSRERVFLYLALAVFFLCLPLAFLLGRWMARRFSRPIRELIDSANTIAAGNLEHRVSIDRDDEIGKLAGAFNAMADRLTQTLDTLRREAVERRNAEAQASSLGQFQQSVIETANVWINVADRQGNMLVWNRAAGEISGYPAEDVLGHNLIWTWLYPDEAYRRRITDKSTAIIEKGESAEAFETTIRTRSGEYKTISWYSRGLYDGNGEPTGSVALGVDITAHKETLADLAMFRDFAESSGQGLGMADINGRITYVNTRLRDMLAEDNPPDIVGRYVFEFYPASLQRRLADEILPSVLRDGYWCGEIPFITTGNRQIPTIQSISLIRDHHGRPRCFASIITDITERKFIEMALRESEARFRDVVENSPFPIVIIAGSGRIEFINQTFTDIFGYAPEDIPTLDHWREQAYPDPEYRREILKTWEEDVISKETRGVTSRIFNVTCKDGSVRQIVFRLVKLQGGQMYIICEDVTDRRQIEERLRTSEAQYRTLFESAAEAIFIMKGDRWIDCNLKTLEMFGCGREAIVGHSPEDFSPPAQPDGGISPDKARLKIEAALQGAPQVFDWTHCRSDGTPFETEVSLNRFEIEHEYFLLAIVRDITERKKTEKALLESETMFRTLTETTSSAIFIVQGDRFVYMNHAGEEISGYSLDELREMRFWDIVHPDFRNIIRERGLARQKGEELPGHYEFKIITRQEEERWLDFNAAFITFRGEPAMLGTAFDITERKRIIRALESSERRYRLLAENVTDVIWTMDLNQRFTYVSPSVTGIVGYTPEELMAISPDRTVTPDSYQQIAAALGPLLEPARAGKPHPVDPITLEVQHVHKDGSLIWTEVNYTFIIDEKGRTTGIMGVTRDISERKKAERDKAQVEDQLRQSQKMEAVGRLAGGIAHDFNNLLMAIMGNAELMLMDNTPGTPVREEIREIKKAGERAAALTRQLLAFSRKQMLQPTLLDLNRLVAGIQKMLARLIGEDIQLSSSLEADPAYIKADPGQVEQTLLNLAVNARDAMEGGGRLTLATENVLVDEHYCRMEPEARPGHFVCLSVSDTGRGIPPDVARHIFEPFFTTRESGTGLGLAVVYGIVKQHGGWIRIYSIPDQGTTFKVYFPITDITEPDHRDESAPTLDLSGRGERILVVEDEDGVRKITVRTLMENGYEVAAAATAEQAVEIATTAATPFDLVFSDVVLPDEGGLQLLERLQRRQPGLRGILTSGYADHKSQWPDINRRGIPFLAKPYPLADLLRIIREVLDDVPAG